jgi:glutamyl-tRNA synthetase
MSVVVRFAPSPTGKLHVGNIRAALWNFLYARAERGAFILRIDDTDRERSTPAYEEAIKRDLLWLGLAWDQTFRQSERLADYDAVADALKARGLLYPCFETAEELERKRRIQLARKLPPVYDRAALALTDENLRAYQAQGRKPHWRFKLSGARAEWDDLIRGRTSVDTASLSDPVLIREDGGYLYTLSSCIDDIDYKISHVIRGEDHVTNAGVQVEIMRAVIDIRGAGDLPHFAHFSLLVGADGQGLSKRLGALSIESMREAGIEPAAITSLLARLGTSDPVKPERDLAALAAGFSFDRVGRAPARFDEADLQALNARILHETPYAALAERLATIGVSERLWDAVKSNVSTLAEAGVWRGVIEGAIEPVIENKAVTDAAARLAPEGGLGPESWGAFVAAVKAQTGAQGKHLFRPLRLALLGRPDGPEMDKVFPLLGAARIKARLSGARA